MVKEINELEEYLLNFSLKWKLFYLLPYDILASLVTKLLMQNEIDTGTSALILDKASQVIKSIMLSISYSLS